MQNGCQFHIKFHEESKNEVYFNLRSYPMKAKVKAEYTSEQSFIKSNKIGNRYSTNCTSLLVPVEMGINMQNPMLGLLWPHK